MLFLIEVGIQMVCSPVLFDFVVFTCSLSQELMVGTVDYPARIHQFKIEFKPYFGTTPVDGDQLFFTYLDTTLLYDNRVVLTTG